MEAYKRKQEELKREEEAKKFHEEYKKKEDIARGIGWLLTAFGLFKDSAPSGVDLAEENKTPETQSEYLLQGGNAIDNANYPYPVD